MTTRTNQDRLRVPCFLWKVGLSRYRGHPAWQPIRTSKHQGRSRSGYRGGLFAWCALGVTGERDRLKRPIYGLRRLVRAWCWLPFRLPYWLPLSAEKAPNLGHFRAILVALVVALTVAVLWMTC